MPLSTHYLAALPLVVFSLLAGCDLQENEEIDPLTHPEFLTPVAEAQEAGIAPYWMGEGFSAESLNFDLRARAEAFELDSNPHLVLNYGAKIESGTVPFQIESHSDESSAARRTRASYIANLFRRPGQQLGPKDVTVGPWRGEVFTLPGPAEPANEIWLIVDVGSDAAVMARAISGSTGVPGTDVNPLLDEDLLISTVADYLRPYPE